MASSVSSEELVESIVKNILLWRNPFDVFTATLDTPLDELEKRYKKLALKIHPDKCKHPQAMDAFDALKKSLKLLKEPESRAQYGRVMKTSRDRVTEQWKKDGRSRNNRFEEKEFERDVKKMTQKLIIDGERSAKRALEMRLANERREKEEEMSKIKEMKAELEAEKVWDDSRTERVNSWRDFKQMNYLPPDPEEKRKRKKAEAEAAAAASTPIPSEGGTVPPPPLQESIPPPPPPMETPPSESSIPLPPPTPAPPAPSMQKKEPKPKAIPMLGVEPAKKKRYTGGPLKPPKVKLFST